VSVRSILIITNDDVAGLKDIKTSVGDNPDVTQNPICNSLMTVSGWYLCSTTDYGVLKGKYFGVFSVNQIDLQKVAIYS
jgi:hypothetical protein